MIGRLIEQSKRPKGLLGRFLLWTMGLAHRRLTSWGLKQLDLSTDHIVLDVGCGGGEAVDQLSRTVTDGTVHGLDLSRTAITKASRTTDGPEESRVGLSQGTVSALPFAEETFDVITAFQAHYHWPRIETDLQEIHRVLRPGGTVMLVAERDKLAYHLERYETPDATVNLLEAVGFLQCESVTHSKWLCVMGKK